MVTVQGTGWKTGQVAKPSRERVPVGVVGGAAAALRRLVTRRGPVQEVVKW